MQTYKVETMGYYLCLKRCFKKYLLYRGYVLEYKPGKYLIPLAIQSKPEGEIQTFVNGSIILSNNNEYDFKRKLIDRDYEGVYKTGESEYFIVTQKGQEAVLKMITRDEAKKLWYELPNKVIKNDDVFLDSLEAKKMNAREIIERWELEERLKIPIPTDEYFD